MEGEQGAQHTETDEDEGEEHLLDVDGDIVHSSYLVDVHGGSTTEVVDAQQTDNQQGGTSHQHQRQLHGSILLVAGTPDTNQQVHGNQRYLVEHEHGEHIGADEEASCQEAKVPVNTIMLDRSNITTEIPSTPTE